METVQLRVKDLDFDLDQIVVRMGKGMKDRYVPLPQSLRDALRRQVRTVRELSQADRKRGAGWVALPGALHR